MSLAVLDLEVLFHLSYTETEVECLKTLAVESLTATDSLGMPWRSCRLTTASSWHCPNHRWLSWSRDDWTSPSRSQWGNWTCGSLSAQHCCGWCAWDGKGAHCPEIRTLNCYKSIIIHPLKSRLTDSTECPVGCTTSIGCGLTTAWLHWALSCFHWKSQSLKVECALGWLVSRWIVWHHWPRNWKAHVRISLQRTGRTHCTDCQSGSDVGFQAHWHHLWVPVRRAGDCIGDWSSCPCHCVWSNHPRGNWRRWWQHCGEDHCESQEASSLRCYWGSELKLITQDVIAISLQGTRRHERLQHCFTVLYTER